MEINLKISDIDYEKIIDRAIPILKERAKTDGGVAFKTIAGILDMPGDIPKKMLNALPQETKDELLVYIINNNSEKICKWFEGFLSKNGIGISIEELKLNKD